MSNHNPYTGQFNSEYNQSEESFEVHDGKEENQAESPEISEHVSNEVEPAKEAMSEGNSSEIHEAAGQEEEHEGMYRDLSPIILIFHVL